MDKLTLLTKARDYVSREQDPFFKRQVEVLIEEDNLEELNDRFYTDLEFGTGGLRGVIGGGFNRMNPYIIQKSTQGLATYVLKHSESRTPSAVIAYDSRNFSDLFALEAARVLCANGIRTYLFTSLRPTPELSFAVRHLKASVGIVVTASHNPPAYNGYKVYWNDGAQVVAPHDDGIISEVRAVTDNIKLISKHDALNSGMLVMIDREVDEPYIRMVRDQALRPDLIREHGKKLKVVYTPLHGSGTMPVETALSEMGINVVFVEEQKQPNGNFPTVKVPNPEEAAAMQMALDLAKKEHANLVMGTDPDADRFGIAIPEGNDFRLITGNQLGALLADYIFSTRKELGSLPAKAAFVKTIVTTELQTLIAKEYGVLCFDVLTGFKFIGEKIREFESQSDGPVYLFGGEESYGFLVGTHVRDKDAVSAAAMTSEMTLYHLTNGRSLMDRLKEIWLKYGYFQEGQISKHFTGEKGLHTMNEFMTGLRTKPPLSIGNEQVIEIRDFKDGSIFDVAKNSKENKIDLPSSNVLQFILADMSTVTVRPSGTEPKIKLYASCRSKAGVSLETAKTEVNNKITTISDSLHQLMDKQ